MAQEQAFHLLGSVMNDLAINTTDPSTPAPPPPSISDGEAWAILWCLSKLNFRVQLLALHQHVKPGLRNDLEGDQAICDAPGVSLFLSGNIDADQMTCSRSVLCLVST